MHKLMREIYLRQFGVEHEGEKLRAQFPSIIEDLHHYYLREEQRQQPK